MTPDPRHTSEFRAVGLGGETGDSRSIYCAAMRFSNEHTGLLTTRGLLYWERERDPLSIMG